MLSNNTKKCKNILKIISCLENDKINSFVNFPSTYFYTFELHNKINRFCQKLESRKYSHFFIYYF